MTRVPHFISKHRKLSVSIFAVVYPFLAVGFRQLFWHQLNPLFDALADRINWLPLAIHLIIYFVPVLVAFWSLPFQSRHKPAIIITISLLYLLAMAWPVYFASWVIGWWINPHGAPL